MVTGGVTERGRKRDIEGEEKERERERVKYLNGLVK